MQGREAVLQELHEGHPGMTKMKALARMYVWWPGMEKDIETAVRTCRVSDSACRPTSCSITSVEMAY